MELKIEKVSKRYPNGVQALKDVTLSISNGMYGLLGPNGAGKSTLMRIIATLQDADSGSISLDGLDVLREKTKVREILGYLPQDFGFSPKASATEMLNHFAALKGVPSKDRKAVVENLLKRTNLHHVRHRRLGGFSGGMKQRLGIAITLLGNPKLIIVDEPTAGLDPEERVRFLNLLSEIGDDVIVILSTHIVDDVSDLCHNMAIINLGEVIKTGPPLELLDKLLRGRLWKKFVEKNEVAELGKRLRLLCTRRLAGRTQARVFSESRPDTDFEPLEPELEDLYFAAIKGTISADI